MHDDFSFVQSVVFLVSSHSFFFFFSIGSQGDHYTPVMRRHGYVDMGHTRQAWRV